MVFGRFLGNENKSNKLNILVYGHYDVIAADETKWSSSPFKMSGKDGYLYGRGEFHIIFWTNIMFSYTNIY